MKAHDKLQRLVFDTRSKMYEIIEHKYQAKREKNHDRAQWLDGRLCGMGSILCDVVDILVEEGIDFFPCPSKGKFDELMNEHRNLPKKES